MIQGVLAKYTDLEVIVTYTIDKGCEGIAVDFRAYEIAATSMEGRDEMYVLRGASSPEGLTFNFTKAQPLIEGTVKWDGCSHYNFGNEGYIHLCGKDYILNISELIKRIYFKCGELMNRDKEKAFIKYEKS